MLAKKIHRIFLFATTFVVLIMGMTGFFIKYTNIAERFGFIDLVRARYIHNQLSPWLNGLLLIMIITGAIMYFYPWYTKRKQIKISTNSQK